MFTYIYIGYTFLGHIYHKLYINFKKSFLRILHDFTVFLVFFLEKNGILTGNNAKGIYSITNQYDNWGNCMGKIEELKKEIKRMKEKIKAIEEEIKKEQEELDRGKSVYPEYDIIDSEPSVLFTEYISETDLGSVVDILTACNPDLEDVFEEEGVFHVAFLGIKIRVYNFYQLS